MSVSEWKCDHDGCTRLAHGTGPATGLRSVGWTVIVGGPYPLTYCPDHHVNPKDCSYRLGPIETRPSFQCRHGHAAGTCPACAIMGYVATFPLQQTRGGHVVHQKCTCCLRGDEYNGFKGRPPKLFECPKGCGCHD